jgi:hypothetical protein
MKLSVGWVDELPPEQESEEWQRMRERGLRPFKEGPKQLSISRGARRGGRSKQTTARLNRLLGKADE